MIAGQSSSPGGSGRAIVGFPPLSKKMSHRHPWGTGLPLLGCYALVCTLENIFEVRVVVLIQGHQRRVTRFS